MLDQIEEQEKVKDDDVAEIDSATHVVNEDWTVCPEPPSEAQLQRWADER